MSKYIETKLQKQNNSAYPYVFIIVFFGYFSTGGPSSKYEHPRASALFHNIRYVEDITQWREETNFIFRVAKQYFTNERSKLVKCCFCHEKIKFISSGRRVMFFLLYRQKKDIDKIVDFYSPKQVIVWQRLQDAFKFRREITEITSLA